MYDRHVLTVESMLNGVGMGPQQVCPYTECSCSGYCMKNYQEDTQTLSLCINMKRRYLFNKTENKEQNSDFATY